MCSWTTEFKDTEPSSIINLLKTQKKYEGEGAKRPIARFGFPAPADLHLSNVLALSPSPSRHHSSYLTQLSSDPPLLGAETPTPTPAPDP
ncbi:hypothetical protein RO3G_17296 [Rhizopus delemar RA 99-880]|uniref:Uncharacterized protein n=1 Tax=Rhizopus delemar (strain RA 99-880 / ATCC MYA-4621 / FGSC 9543 / NRRL 43880) TaxID=246409 RepID=I1CVV5_RHIO9|nr:hypothetical protein RO3G_17296 [Rhizopus delemar RA 99-880]|eukprot:EIE92585.1 hypothetical protein RO3G_17296 [Rhizopus delemar RA 99-880]